MNFLKEKRPEQILILAPELLGETLAVQLSNSNKNIKAVLSTDQLTRHPGLVIWSVDNNELPSSIQIELSHLQERWAPSPILIILPAILNLSAKDLLQFNCSGLLQDPNFETLSDSIETLLGGGRVVRLNKSNSNNFSRKNPTLSLGQWLLISGLQQINDDLEAIRILLDPPPSNPLSIFILLGRQRELNQAKSLLNFLWGPMRVSITSYKPFTNTIEKVTEPTNYDIEINLKKKDPISIWEELYSKVENSIQNEILNSTGNLLALEGIKPSFQKELFVSLLNQLNDVLKQIREQKDQHDNLNNLWIELQTKIRQQALRSVVGSYIKLPFSESVISVADELLARANLNDIDEELPKPSSILDPLILNKPVLIEGQFTPSDSPPALIHLEILIQNWIIRTAEIISAEIISISSEWPEFRNYTLKKKYISTRELEKLRNQLNSQNQLQSLIKRPIRLYESKRLLYTLNQNEIETLIINESRDEELYKLGWWQQQVALLIEARDAIAPQLQTLVKYLGDLMVVLLTKVIGRGIGLVGKGIAQGMGRSLTKRKL